MRPLRRLSVFAALAVALAIPATAGAAPSPAWKLTLTSNPTLLPPGPLRGVFPQYTAIATNGGSVPTAGSIVFSDTLPAGLSEIAVEGKNESNEERFGAGQCPVSGQTVTCTVPGPVDPGKQILFSVKFGVDPLALPEGSLLSNRATISGGGAPASTTATTTTTVSSARPSFDFVDGVGGFSANATEKDGAAASQAGSHPYQLAFDLGFTTRRAASGQSVLGAQGGVRDVATTLPRGLVVDPTATPLRCTEVELETGTCPLASQVGTVVVLTSVVGLEPDESPLYNMVSPPGSAAEFGFEAAGVGIFVHIKGGLRAGDYAIAGTSADTLALANNPVLGVKVRLWGDPSDPSHNTARGDCGYTPINPSGCPEGEFSVPSQDSPLLTMPTGCQERLTAEAEADPWGEPGNFRTRSTPLSDFDGAPATISGCNKLKFQPTLEAHPTTDLADSPSGLTVDLGVPLSDSLKTRATAHLRKAVVSLPEGLTLNPASANGLEGCTSAQIGIDPGTGVPDGNQPTCPDASRIGHIEVDTPLLDHALPGSVYVATPYDNPFDSLLAIYVTVEDPISGVLIKLAGHVVADPETGQLRTTFDNSPQLPFEDFKLDFFGGPGGVLRTPSVCGSYSTDSTLTPWSAPDSGPPASVTDSWSIAGSCASSESAMPDKPEFEAGAESPIAGRYTPFVVHLRREDGSQQFSKLTLKPPPGLTAKLADTPACSTAALAAAAGRSGREEQAHPDCSSASKIGTVHVGVGAGPAPYHAEGAAYLAGPYKGAPLSMAIVTPAVAGPYDLGTVVTRVALHIDPTTAQITADADPIPHILQGIPLDVRSIDVSLDKPDFSRTGTSCDPFSVSGQLISTLGKGADLESRYQLGNCANLAFKPKLKLQLKGKVRRTAHPRLIATLKAREGEANIARAQVKLPAAVFLDQGHIKTVCTRVQWAADTCPAGSVYGRAVARTPLLGYPLSGSVYLRSSSHRLPDLVVKLRGPDYQPIEIDLDGRTDSVKGALRNTFEAVPDAPVSSFRLELFGGKRGLVEMSSGFCEKRRAAVNLKGQNGKLHDTRPVVAARCPKRHKKHHKRRQKGHHRRHGGHHGGHGSK